MTGTADARRDDIAAKSHATEPVHGRRPLTAVRDLVIREGGWRAAANAAGIGIGTLAATACGMSARGEDAIAAISDQGAKIPRWRRWLRNAGDTAAMAMAFPFVLGYSGTKHRGVWQIPAIQAAPVALIAAFFLFGAIAKGVVPGLMDGGETLWLWRVGVGSALAILGLYAAGIATRIAVEKTGPSRILAAVAAIGIAAVTTAPFSNAVLDISAENRNTTQALRASLKRNAELMAKIKAEPTYNAIPEQRQIQKDLLADTRQAIPDFLQSDEAYVAHLRKCLAAGLGSAGCAPKMSREDYSPLSAGRAISLLWERQWR